MDDLVTAIASLEEERRRLDREIRSYPTPIPRCDAQFNHLFDRRETIAREIHRLKEALKGPG